MNTSTLALVRLAPGSEEAKAVTATDLLVHGGIKVTIASVANGGNLAAIYPRGVRPLVNAPLVEVVDGEYDMTASPDGIRGVKYLRDSALLVETVKQFHRSGHTAAVICAVSATVLVPHDAFPIGNTTDSSTLKDKVPARQWQDRRVIRNARAELLISQGPGTVIGFDLKTTDLLVGCEKTREVASQLTVAAGIYSHYE